jgi:hypothetical protein
MFKLSEARIPSDPPLRTRSSSSSYAHASPLIVGNRLSSRSFESSLAIAAAGLFGGLDQPDIAG